MLKIFKIIKPEFYFMRIHRKRNMFFIVAILVVGCSKQSSLEKEVAAKMFDPSSVEFREISITKSKPIALCGEINAKNQFGGYVGYKRFYYVSGSLSISPEAPDEPFLQDFTDNLIDDLASSSTINDLASSSTSTARIRTLVNVYGIERIKEEAEKFDTYIEWNNSYVNICK